MSLELEFKNAEGEPAELERIHGSLIEIKAAGGSQTKHIDPIQYAYRALILRHNELQADPAMNAEAVEAKIIWLRAYEEAIATVDQYRKCE